MNLDHLLNIEPFGNNPRQFKCVTHRAPREPFLLSGEQVDAFCPGFTDVQDVLFTYFHGPVAVMFMKQLKADKELYPNERYIIHGSGYLTPWREWVGMEITKGDPWRSLSLVRQTPHGTMSFYLSDEQWEHNIPGFTEQYDMAKLLGCTEEQATAAIKAFFMQGPHNSASSAILPNCEI